MRKIIVFMIFVFTIGGVLAYTPSEKDEKIVEKATTKISNFIDKYPDKRDKAGDYVINKINEYLEKYKKGTRGYYIINQVKKNTLKKLGRDKNKSDRYENINYEKITLNKAKEYDKKNDINRIYGSKKNETLKGKKNSRNIIWGKMGKDEIYGGKKDDIIIVLGDMRPYEKNNGSRTRKYLGKPMKYFNGINFAKNGIPKLIDGGKGYDILFIVGDTDLTDKNLKNLDKISIY